MAVSRQPSVVSGQWSLPPLRWNYPSKNQHPNSNAMFRSRSVGLCPKGTASRLAYGHAKSDRIWLRVAHRSAKRFHGNQVYFKLTADH
ncbi:MAG: hypothetical protein F6J90_08165 [Moorea sp. SIOASIH]|uniref:hypothetical protein n=1 Tax=Moorena sp. SIOASIH TaxID=2607817 RepID=UPI0013B7C346|nr:hypothetical protein [Moorena sp. SIOASIH]NEO36295.1 hypothetical protein [Moorena sp. SIOASIH]